MSDETSSLVDEPFLVEEPVSPCRSLRTKMYHVMGPSFAECGASSPTAQYWCLHTMQPFGPDGCFVSPEGCREGRGCFRGYEQEELSV